MILSEYPSCCGIYIINDLANKAGRIVDDIKVTEERIIKLMTDKNVGAFLLALNHYQKGVYAKMMERLEFQEVFADFYHPGHGHTISLYGKIVYGTGQKPDVIPEKTKNSVFQKTNPYTHY